MNGLLLCIPYPCADRTGQVGCFAHSTPGLNRRSCWAAALTTDLLFTDVHRDGFLVANKTVCTDEMGQNELLGGRHLGLAYCHLPWSYFLYLRWFSGIQSYLSCLFVSIHGSVDKQRKNSPSWRCLARFCHPPYTFNSLHSCLFLMLCSGWGIVQLCGWRPTAGPDILAPSSSDECLRECSWGGTAPRSQMFVKNRLPVRETNGLGVGQMYGLFCFSPQC